MMKRFSRKRRGAGDGRSAAIDAKQWLGKIAEQGIVEATAPEMEYQRSTGILRLSGGAMLKLDDEVIQSTVIEYNIDTERYQAGGVNGVLIEVPPVD